MTDIRLGDCLEAHWTRTHYKLTMVRPSGRVKVDGITLKACPFLGLHLGQTGLIDVTHLPSGRRIADFRTLGAAMEYVTKIAPLTDWSTEIPDITPEVEKTLLGYAFEMYKTETRPQNVKVDLTVGPR